MARLADDLDDFDDDNILPKRTPRRKPAAAYIPTDSGTPEDTVQRLYGIPALTPHIERVERLLLMDVDPLDIAQLLEKTPAEVDTLVARVHKKWRRVGEPLEAEERTFARGRAIRSLEVLRITTGRSEDSRAQSLLLQIEQQLIKLRGLDKAELTDGSDVPVDTLSETLNTITDVGVLEKLRELLNGTTPALG